MIIYRKFQEKDIESIRDILDKDLGYNVVFSDLKARIEEMTQRGNYHIFVACDQEKIVGYAGFTTFLAFEVDNEAVKILALAVKADYRRQGIGKGLMNEVEIFAKMNSMNVLSLNSGLVREDAHKFYESIGYYKKSYGFIKNLS
ncbi:MAG: GNAT family N-acetyltransferase [Clostridia bacterium]|nr:GNAT family N-acetyltransferase [Clostridia bacterium]